MTTTAPETTTTEKIEHCYNHPDRETYLHCSQCDRPICGQCAKPGPVGQLCPECRRGRRPANYKVSVGDLAIGFGVALVVSALISLGVLLFARGFFFLFLLLFLGPAIAELIVRAVERTTRMKRGREMQLAVSAAILLGAFVAWLLFPVSLPLGLLLFAILAVSTAVARLR